ncbi:hypothetical protein [Photorhabdus aegyptia]|uniref:hypothetical protein n=1 Tax=Photorhabdus aegyptia TaxID=2805098 RepID=UPI001E49D712|nr:hypothetical protein [Photorhabdus aegyptia]
MTEIETQINYDFSPDMINQQKVCLLTDLNTVFNQHNGQGLLMVDTAVFLDRRQEEWFPKAVLNHQPAAIPTQINHLRYASRYSPWLIPLDINRSEDAELLVLSVTQALQEADPAELITGRGRILRLAVQYQSSPCDCATYQHDCGTEAIISTGNHAAFL